MQLEWRDATVDDVAAIVALLSTAAEAAFAAPSLPWPISSEAFEQLRQQRLLPTVITHHSTVVAYSNAYQKQDDFYVGNVIVSGKLRRRGVARFLIATMEQRLQQYTGCQRVRISCFEDNVAGLGLYQALGYLPVGSEPRTGPDGQSRLLFHLQKTL